MTTFEWTMVILTALGVVITSVGMIVVTTRNVTREVEALKTDMTKRIADEVIARNEAIGAAARAFDGSQDIQDHNVGETVSALRRFIETVERQMHQIEIWGRDHYVQKADFNRALDTLSTDMRAGFASLSSALTLTRTELKEEIKNSHVPKD